MMHKRNKRIAMLSMAFAVIFMGAKSLNSEEITSYAKVSSNYALAQNVMKYDANTEAADKVETTSGSVIVEEVTSGSSVVEDTTKPGVEDEVTEDKKLDGWIEQKGKWLYYKNGVVQKKKADWYKIQGIYLYLKADGTRVSKAKGYYFIGDKWNNLSAEGKILSCTEGWQKISKKWYYIKKDGKYLSGWKTVSGKKYYFGKQGLMTDGWVKVGKEKYYQKKDKGLYKNAVLKDASDGKYYYVDGTGKRVDNKLTKELVKVYRKCTKETMTKEQKLRAMYLYLGETNNSRFRYERRYDDKQYIGKGTWTSDFAYQILSTKKGNCYRFACAFGYMAKMLGYDVYVNPGQCHARRGGLTPHCWVEIKMNGTTYVYDPELQFAGSASDLYQKTYKTYPIQIKKGKSYKIKW